MTGIDASVDIRRINFVSLDAIPNEVSTEPQVSVAFGFSGMPNWGGQISRLSGPDLGTHQVYVDNLPRSARDHLTNSIEFGPDGRAVAFRRHHGSDGCNGETCER